MDKIITISNDYIIKSVNEGENAYSITTTDSVGFWFSKEYGVTPKEGDAITLYCHQGSSIRGIDINGVRIFYKTDQQLEEERETWLKEHNRKKLEEFEKNKPQLDADYQALPEVFQKRINRFRKNNPNFRVDYEAYEMFCCKEAVKIASALKTADKVEEYSKMDVTQQKELVPGLSDEHSGNTFGFSVYLAFFYLHKPDNITRINGALSPLVGSEEYGDIEK